MVKKLKKMASKQSTSSGQLAATVKDSAQQIWLAGMGAFSKAQAEGGKVFEALVKEGQTLQRKTQAVAEDRLQEVTGKMTAVADGVASKAGQQWDKLEGIFEQRVAKAMSKMGVPSNKDIDALVARIDALSAKLGVSPVKAAPRKAAAKKAGARKTTVKKPATRKLTVKKAAAKKPVAKKAVARKSAAQANTAA